MTRDLVKYSHPHQRSVAKFDPGRSIHNHLVACLAIIIVLVGGIGGWAASTEISGAVIAPGQLVVDTNSKKVQHPTGGVVGELRVRDGDFVKAGDTVIRLDETVLRANLAVVTKGLDELAARKAREEAEREGADTIKFPAELVARSKSDPELAQVISGETTLFEIRRNTRNGQKAQLRERILQLKEEIRGLNSQEAGKGKEIEWIKKELAGVRELWNKNLVQFTRVTALERDAARVEGERGHIIAQMAQSRGKIAEIELAILQVDQDMRTEVSKDLAEVRAKTAELVEKRVAAEDQLMRVDIRAPQSGRVHQLDVHTVGGVITPGQPIMMIVPAAEQLVVEAKIPPQDVDQLHVGQRAILRFSAFNQTTTPELNGEVSVVSADVTTDQKSGASYYTVRISVPDNELARLSGLKLVPGMPVESFIQTSPRTVISYIVRPLHDQLARAFREK